MRSLLVLGAALLLGLAQSATEAGCVRGVVVDPAGRPVANALISAFPIVGIHSGPVRGTRSAVDGTFTIPNLTVPQNYRVSASSEENGVPDARFDLFEQPGHTPITIHLLPDSPEASVHIELPPPFGRLTGSLVDAHTGSTLRGRARITFRAQEQPSMLTETDLPEGGAFSFLFPERPILVGISYPGCEPWQYATPSSDNTPVLLHTGESKQIVVALNCNHPLAIN